MPDPNPTRSVVEPTADPVRTHSAADPQATTGGECSAGAAPPPATAGSTFPPEARELLAAFHLTATPAPAGAPAAADWAIPGYEVEGELARGGMGLVLAARDLAFGRPVAVKVIRPDRPASPAVVARFHREARIAGQLQHPGIPPVHHIGTLPDGRPFLAMKLIRGQTLDAILANPANGATNLVAIFEAICQAVAYAHAHQVIHRDLKPVNVMVGSFGEVQVMDWGLGKVLSEPQPREDSGEPAETVTLIESPRESDGSATRTGSVLGTPAFMPPEQAAGATGKIDARSDVFGLGGILAMILTGRPVFVGTSAETVRLLAVQGRVGPCFARLDASGAEPELVALCKRCLAPDPADRPRDADEVAKAVAGLRAAADERAKQAELARATAAEQRKRARVQLVLAAAVGLLMLGGGAVAWWQDKQAADRRAGQAATDTERRLKAEAAREQVTRLIALATELRREYRFTQATATLDQARDAASAGAADLLPGVEQARADLGFVAELDAVRMRRSTWVAGPGGKGRMDWAGAPPAYRAAFASRGLDVAADAEGVGARVAASAIRVELVSALDDWLILEPDAAVRGTLVTALDRADPDSPAAPFRDPAVWRDRPRLAKLAAELDVARLSPGAAVAVASVLFDNGLDPVPLLRHAVARHPRDFQLVFVLGQVFERRPADLDERIGAFRAARAIRPDHYATLINLGLALADRKEYAGAEATCREAVRVDPRSAQARSNLGDVLSRRGNLDEAVAVLREAIGLDPQAATTHYNLGVALGQKKDYAGAVAAYRETVRLDPQNVKAHNNLGVALKEQNDWVGAVAAYRDAIRLDPKHAPAHFNLGGALLVLGDFEGSVAAFREAHRCDPTLGVVRQPLGILLAAKGKHLGSHQLLTEAIGHLTEAVRLNSKEPLIHSSLGDALLQTGDLDGAIEHLTEAVRLDPKNVETVTQLKAARQQKANRTAPPPREVKR